MTEGKEGVTEQLGPDDFGYGWSEEKLLCYWVRCDVNESMCASRKSRNKKEGLLWLHCSGNSLV